MKLERFNNGRRQWGGSKRGKATNEGGGRGKGWGVSESPIDVRQWKKANLFGGTSENCKLKKERGFKSKNEVREEGGGGRALGEKDEKQGGAN